MTWLDGFERRDLGPDGGPYDRFDNPKILWHTWQGYGWSGAESAFATYPPHIAVSPKDRQKRQYVSLDRHAYAIAGSDSEDSWVIQIEVAGFAEETHLWSQDDLKWLGEEVLAPILEHVPAPGIVCPQGFHGAGEGIVLASPDSPIRFPNVAAWDAFSGHVGHQHAPAPDHHWDPGRLNVAAIIDYAQGPKPEPIRKKQNLILLNESIDGYAQMLTLDPDGIVVNSWETRPGSGDFVPWVPLGPENSQPFHATEMTAGYLVDGRIRVVISGGPFGITWACEQGPLGGWGGWRQNMIV